MDAAANDPALEPAWQHNLLYRWWRLNLVGNVDHETVMRRICDDSGCSPRYAAREAVLTVTCAARRWNWSSPGVPGLPAWVPGEPGLPVRRALSIAAMLRDAGVTPVSASAAGASFTLAEPAA